MAEATETKVETKAEEPKRSFEDYLAETGMPIEAFKSITDKVSEHNSLVLQVNEWVAQVNAAKAQDPSKPGYEDYLDSLWKTEQEKGNDKVKELADEFDVVSEQYEKLLKQLRGIAKDNFIPEQLTQEAAQQKRAQVNSATPTIAETRKNIAAQLELVENILKLKNVELPEGGLVTLLPQADSLKNQRGRKAVSAADGILKYMTRVYDVLIDGESTRTEKGGKFNYAADALSKRFGDPANAVTAEELETAYYESLNIPHRLKDANLPLEHEFTFEKTIRKQNPNDDSFTEVPAKVTLKVQSEKYGKQLEEKAEAESKPEATNDAPANGEAVTESKPTNSVAPEPMKIDTRTETQKANDEKAPAKKAAPAKPAAK